MKFSKALKQGQFLKRYKRFFADVALNGETVVAHVPNTGSLKGVNIAGQPCRVSESDNPERKLKFTLEMIQAPSGAWVGVNTSTPNTVMKETLFHAVKENRIFAESLKHWTDYSEVKPEYKISKETRLDFCLYNSEDGPKHFVEVKNTTLADGDIAKFPDAVTERGQKHLRELMSLIEKGNTAEIVFTIQRNDCTSFAPADDIDPEYGRLLREAIKAGVKVSPLVLAVSEDGVFFEGVVLPLNI